MNKERLRRIPLGEEAFGLLTREVQRLKDKGTHYKVNEAKLAGFVVSRYFAELWSRDQDAIEERFMDKKAYLKHLIEGAKNDQDLAQSLDAFLHEAHSQKRQKRRKKAKEDLILDEKTKT